jgi:hypothetical protein
MGLLDRFTRKDPLVQWLEEHYRGRAHGRVIGVVPKVPASAKRSHLQISLETAAEPEHLQMQRPQTYLAPEQANALPSVTDADWPQRMQDDAQGLRLGGGFVLDPDFNPDSPLVHARAKDLVTYLERFSRSVEVIRYEPPMFRLLVAADRTTPDELRRDIERGHELLCFLERPL